MQNVKEGGVAIETGVGNAGGHPTGDARLVLVEF